MTDPEAAADRLMESVGAWKSPYMGSVVTAEEWLQEPLPQVQERADTPVMSNSSSPQRTTRKSPRARVAQDTSLKTSDPKNFLEYVKYHKYFQDFLVSKREQTHYQQTNNSHADIELLELLASHLATPERRVWYLMFKLAQIGPSSLLWNDDAASDRQNASALQGHVASVALESITSFQTLIESLYSTKAPEVLRRRRAVKLALEHHLAELVPPFTVPNPPRINSSLFHQGLIATDQDSEILEQALKLVVAGKFEAALDLFHNCQVPWRAQMFSQGPNVFLWKHMMWRLSEQNKPDSPLAAVLSSNVRVALNHPALHNFEAGFYILMRSMIASTEDQAFAQSSLSTMPNSQRDYLSCTQATQLAHERDAYRQLLEAPVEALRPRSVASVAFASLVVGKSKLEDFFETNVQETQDLRFVTHLAVYLDSLGFGPDYKDELVLKYLAFLATYPDLWGQIPLYAAFLSSPDLILNEVPQHFLGVEGASDRESLVKTCQELWTGDENLTVHVLQRVVDFIFAQPGDAEENTVSPLDLRKMRAVLWFCHDKNHAGHALIRANELLRKFLLQEQFVCADKLVTEILPGDFLDDMEGESSYQVNEGRSEFDSFIELLQAVRVFKAWQETVDEERDVSVEATLDYSTLNASEQEIAKANENREFNKSKLRASETVIEAANVAFDGLSKVLCHPGGWLYVEMTDYDNDEEMRRQDELKELRENLLPQVVNMCLEVCVETGNFLLELEIAIQDRYDCDAADVAKKLDLSEPMPPMKPTFWSAMAMSVFELVHDEAHLIRPAFGANDIQKLALQLTDVEEFHLIHAMQP